MTKKIVVVIPTRNELLQNLIAATFSRHERIEYFVWFDEDDREFSSKREFVEKMWSNRSNVVWGQGRIGLIEAQNKGVEYAGKNYYIYQHGHDFIGGGIFALAEYLDNHPDVPYAYGTLQYMGMLNEKVYPVQYEGHVLYEWDFPRNAVLYRADIVSSVGKYRRIHNRPDISTNEEHVLNLDLYRAGYVGHAVKTEAPALYFHVHRGGLTETMAQNLDFLQNAFKQAFPEYRGQLINPALFE